MGGMCSCVVRGGWRRRVCCGSRSTSLRRQNAGISPLSLLCTESTSRSALSACIRQTEAGSCYKTTTATTINLILIILTYRAAAVVAAPITKHMQAPVLTAPQEFDRPLRT